MSIDFTVQIHYGFVLINPKLLYHALICQNTIFHKNGCICYTFQFVYEMTGNYQCHIWIYGFQNALHDLVSCKKVNAVQRFVKQVQPSLPCHGNCNFQLGHHTRGQLLRFHVLCKLHAGNHLSVFLHGKIFEKVLIIFPHI